MKNIFISAVITILFLCLGCLYIPYHAYIHRVPDEKTLASIKEGVTSKEDILMMLGEPDRVRNNERLFLYWWQEEHGGVVAGGYRYFSADTILSTHSLHIEFDENNIVKKFEIKKKGIFSRRTLPDEFYEESNECPE